MKLLLLALLALPAGVQAQAFPEQPVRLVVPFGPAALPTSRCAPSASG